jgi:formylmethanofuran dehydrogenase subunit C
MPITLRTRDLPALPIEADILRPDVLCALSHEEIRRQAIWVGNAPAQLDSLFEVSGDGSDGRLILEGDLSRVDRIGCAMAAGALVVRGDAGAHLGAMMGGGTIEVFGHAADWAGAELRGGLLHIHGWAGQSLGAAYPGSRRGMRGGTILVEGSAGNDVGLAMRRGLIAIRGAAGDGLGRAMIAGSIFTFGPVGLRAGAGMKRGTLALLGIDPAHELELLPTFEPSGTARPPFVAIYLRQLEAWGFAVPASAYSGTLARYNGDRIEGGQGEILVWRQSPGE